MTLDGADDIHAAEDTIGGLQTALAGAAEALHAFYHADTVHLQRVNPFERCPGQPCVRYKALLKPFVRPTCSDGCDEDCDGHHPERED